jgi:predicted nucleotidyltransferase
MVWIAGSGLSDAMATVPTKDRVLSLIEEHQAQIQAFGVKRLGLFGSFVRGQQDQDSDVDLLVEFDSGKKTFDAFMRLAFFLEDLLGRRVELVTPESRGPYIGPRIMNEVKYAAFGT